MLQCPTCGSLVPEGSENCRNCGGRIPAGAASIPVRPAAVGTTPAYRYDDPARSPRAVLPVGGFVASLILLSVPALGLLLALIWACGGCRSHNRRNLARAWLIIWLFLAALAAGAWLILPLAGVDVQGLLAPLTAL